ncbi:MAG: PKD domain-containing protein [Pseudomonadota bacterium]
MKRQVIIAKCLFFGMCTFFLFSSPAFAQDWVQMKSPVSTPLKGIWGSSAGNIYAVGSSAAVIHYDGSDWKTISTLANFTTDLQAVHGTSDKHVVAVGAQGTIIQYDGTAWTNKVSQTTYNLRGVWCASASNLFAVGENGVIVNCNASECAPMSYFTEYTTLNSVWGTTATNVYAVGAGGKILHYDGSSWTAMESNTTETLYSIWGSSAKDIYAAGVKGIIQHYNGTVWTNIPAISRDYYAACGTPSGITPFKLYVAGKDGKIAYYSSGWRDMISGTTNTLQGIWISPANDAFIVGDSGLILLNSTNISPNNTPPTASFTVSYDSKDIATVYVNASESSDVQTTVEDLLVKWNWGDGSAETAYAKDKLATHTYAKTGTFTITLTVKDTGGLEDTATNDITIAGLPDDGKCPAKKLLGDNDPRLETLRQFRDQVLVKGVAGRLLVETYYTTAEALDGFLEKNPALSAIVKKYLENIVPVIEKLLSVQ